MNAAPLPLWRLNLLRVGYAFMGLGLAIVKWPIVLSTPEDWPVAQSVVDSLLASMGVLALLGLRHPTRMLPVLVLESTWKIVWLTAVALPHLMSGPMDAATTSVAINCAFGIVILAVVPWRFAWNSFVTAKGEPWLPRPLIRARQAGTPASSS